MAEIVSQTLPFRATVPAPQDVEFNPSLAHLSPHPRSSRIDSDAQEDALAVERIKERGIEGDDGKRIGERGETRG